MFARHLPPLAALLLGLCFATVSVAQGLRPMTPTEPAALDAKGELNAACALTDDQSDCTRFTGCFGTEGAWFAGRSYGRGEGVLSGAVSDGRRFSGTWVSRNWMGFGEAQVTFSDGETAKVLFTYQDDYTGTTLGNGEASGGARIESWSGNHLARFLTSKYGRPALPCNEYAQLTS